MRLAIVLAVMTLSVTVVPVLSGQQVTGIFNDADRTGMFPTRIAPGSIFLIGGSGLGGSSVEVTVGDTRLEAPLLYASGNWVRAVLPAETPEGDGVVVLRRNGSASYARDIRVVRREFRLYGRSYQAVLAHNVTSSGELQENRYAQPARPGQLVVLWGTGLGTNRELGPAEVLVGDRRTPVQYAGPAACCPGVDEVVFEVPAGIEGCHVPVRVKFLVDGSETNSPALAIAAAEGPCSDPHGFPIPLLEKFESNSTLKQGHIVGYARDPGRPTPTELQYGETGAGNSALAGIFSYGGWNPAALPPLGTCYGEPGTIGPVTTTSRSSRPFDAGPELNLRGPQGPIYVPRRVANPSGFIDYATSAGPDRLEAGNYLLDNGEGAQIGPFQTTFALRDAPFEWTNRQSFNIAAIENGVPITWSGGDPAAGYVVVSARLSREVNDWVVGQGELSSLICVEKVEKQSFTLPPSLLTSNPAAELLTVQLAYVFYHRFPVPGLDFAEFSYRFGSTAEIPLR